MKTYQRRLEVIVSIIPRLYTAGHASLGLLRLPTPHDLSSEIRIVLHRAKVPTEVGNIHLDLLLGPSRRTREELDVTLDVGLEHKLPECTELLKSGVLWPRTVGDLVARGSSISSQNNENCCMRVGTEPYLVIKLLDVNESCRLHPFSLQIVD